MMKATNLILEAKRNKIKLSFKNNYNNEIKPMSYKDIVELKELDKKVINDVKELEKNYQKILSESITSDLSKYENNIENINNLNVLFMEVSKEDNNSLKNILDTLANKYQNIIILIANVMGSKVTFIARSNSIINASDIIKNITSKTNGNGGGSNKFAMGSGNIDGNTNLKEIFNEIKKELK